MSSAGQANEAGSVFRRDAALHFAVHALAGAQVGSLPNSSPVTRIDFETADPTDDIRVTHQDGTQFFISAKRAAGLDKPTEDTVADWVAQASTLRPGDLLILAAAETTGTLKTLQAELDRARAGGDIRGDFGVKLNWLDDRVKPAKLRPLVGDRAHIVEFSRTPTNNTDQNLLVTMMNNLVESHRGAAALDCLATHLHTVAGLGSGSGVETWLELPENKGFRLLPAAGSSAAVRLAKAVTGYRRALTKDQASSTSACWPTTWTRSPSATSSTASASTTAPRAFHQPAPRPGRPPQAAPSRTRTARHREEQSTLGARRPLHPGGGRTRTHPRAAVPAGEATPA